MHSRVYRLLETHQRFDGQWRRKSFRKKLFD